MTIEYFYSELSRFRELIGQRSFWEGPPERRSLAVDGIAAVWIEVGKEATPAMDATMTDFRMREAIFLGMKP